MANEIVVSTTTKDQEKFLNATLLERSHIKLVMGSLCDNVVMQRGAGLTAYFVRYKRMNLPVATITEATDPATSSFELEEVTVAMEEWGDIITVSSRAVLTTKHPLIQQAVELLADNAARVMDREIQIVLLAGTNIQYGDGSVTTRRTVTSAMTLNETVLTKARVALVLAGAPPKGGPSGDAKAMAANGTFTSGQSYVAVMGPGVLGSFTKPGTNLGTWVAAATYANQKALYNYEIGTFLGFRIVETNFIPKFTLLGNSTVAITSGAAGANGMPVITAVDTGGALNAATVYFFKVTRKDLLRGFEESISIAHSMNSGGSTNDNSFTFAMPSTAGYVYNVYFDTVQGGGTGTDATLKLAAENVAASATATVTAVGSGATAPDNILATDAALDGIHPVYIFAEKAVSWVGFFKSETVITPDQSIIGNVLKLKRAVGYKFFGKAVIKDQTRLLRLEVASDF